MNLPNRLTLSRLALVAVFVGLFESGLDQRYTLAFVAFIAASLTDYFDGAIARARNLETDFGRLMDPLADKILTASAFVCLLSVSAMPVWAVIVIISREFLITGLRMLASSKGVILPAEQLGKHKTAWQLITICYFLALLSLMEWTETSWVDTAWDLGRMLLVPLVVFLTGYSGLAYLMRHRDLWRQD